MAKQVMKNFKMPFTPFRKAPIQKEILGLEKSAEEVAYSGAKAVKESVPEKFKQAKEAYKTFVDDADVSNVTVDDLIDVMDRTIEGKQLKGREFIRPAEENLLSLRESIASKTKDAVPDTVETIVDPITNKAHSFITEQGTPRVNPKMKNV